MARRKRNTEVKFIEDRRKRNTTYQKRVEGAKKKAHELATLCAVQTLLISYGPCGQLKTWPESKEEIQAILRRYNFFKRKDSDSTTKFSDMQLQTRPEEKPTGLIQSLNSMLERIEARKQLLCREQGCLEPKNVQCGVLSQLPASTDELNQQARFESSDELMMAISPFLTQTEQTIKRPNAWSCNVADQTVSHSIPQIGQVNANVNVGFSLPSGHTVIRQTELMSYGCSDDFVAHNMVKTETASQASVFEDNAFDSFVTASFFEDPTTVAIGMENYWRESYNEDDYLQNYQATLASTCNEQPHIVAGHPHLCHDFGEFEEYNFMDI